MAVDIRIYTSSSERGNTLVEKVATNGPGDDKAPWVLQVYVHNHYFPNISRCEGALYALTFAITADNCFLGQNNIERVEVCFEGKHCKNGPLIQVKRWIFHPKANDNGESLSEGGTADTIVLLVLDCKNILRKAKSVTLPDFEVGLKLTEKLNGTNLDFFKTGKFHTAKIDPAKDADWVKKLKIFFVKEVKEKESCLLKTGAPLCSEGDKWDTGNDECELMGIVSRDCRSTNYSIIVLNIGQYQTWIVKTALKNAVSCLF